MTTSGHCPPIRRCCSSAEGHQIQLNDRVKIRGSLLSGPWSGQTSTDGPNPSIHPQALRPLFVFSFRLFTETPKVVRIGTARTRTPAQVWPAASASAESVQALIDCSGAALTPAEDSPPPRSQSCAHGLCDPGVKSAEVVTDRQLLGSKDQAGDQSRLDVSAVGLIQLLHPDEDGLRRGQGLIGVAGIEQLARWVSSRG